MENFSSNSGFEENEINGDSDSGSSFPFPWVNFRNQDTDLSKNNNSADVKRNSKVNVAPVETYCICHSTDSASFMIACDYCDHWYHAVCIGLKQEVCEEIENYYCDVCRQNNPHLEITYEKKRPIIIPPVYESETNSNTAPRKKGKKRKRKTFLGFKSRRKTKPKRVSKVKVKDLHDQESLEFQENNTNSRHEQSAALQDITNFSGRNNEDLSTATNNSTTKENKKSTNNNSNDSKSKCHRKSIAASTTISSESIISDSERGALSRCSSSDSLDLEYEPIIPINPKKRHCLGPTCSHSAQAGSKYCSDECGINLAAARIKTFLPERLHKFRTQDTVAERLREELDKVIEEKWVCHAKRELLEKKRQNLENYIDDVKEIIVEPTEEKLPDKIKGCPEVLTSCITCGQDYVTRNVTKHMEKCWRRNELKCSFASYGRSDIEGKFQIFCDTYNKDDKTFCKRFQVLCPEHSKEAKITDEEICGAPLTDQLLCDTDKICTVAKKKCSFHVSWVNLRRAEIDMERYKQWRDYELLLHSEKEITERLESRGNLLGLLLHSSERH